MSLKERIVSWKPTNAFESNLQEHIREKALLKWGVGGLNLTSYLLSDAPSECQIYVSYGGRNLCVTKEGRDSDIGFFVTAQQDADDVRLSIIHKDQHYKFRTRVTNFICIVLGFIFFIVPGALFLCFLIFVQPRMFRKKIQTVIVPVFLKTFEEQSAKARGDRTVI